MCLPISLPAHVFFTIVKFHNNEIHNNERTPCSLFARHLLKFILLITLSNDKNFVSCFVNGFVSGFVAVLLVVGLS